MRIDYCKFMIEKKKLNTSCAKHCANDCYDSPKRKCESRKIRWKIEKRSRRYNLVFANRLATKGNAQTVCVAEIEYRFFSFPAKALISLY